MIQKYRNHLLQNMAHQNIEIYLIDNNIIKEEIGFKPIKRKKEKEKLEYIKTSNKRF